MKEYLNSDTQEGDESIFQILQECQKKKTSMLRSFIMKLLNFEIHFLNDIYTVSRAWWT